ncbi:hypothetical protein NF27_JV00020 [Candidatus Jidaibacter acanthamoeba]|uniref:Resolvase HTH domain-containing protein n=1 Tax=Candidatus Jidaibacter acanthamoebae TaxID=86105 RepID=A0A0C1MW33_9RICK|nr:hypothetical protein NF27_JV00020 [Candidatus Jidaibacter acanthamoeba]
MFVYSPPAFEWSRARGRMGGRPPGLSKKALQKACAAEALYKHNELTSEQIANHLTISKTTLYKYLKIRNVDRHKCIAKPDSSFMGVLPQTPYNKILNLSLNFHNLFCLFSISIYPLI